MTQRICRQDAFTLLEIVAVLVILGVLAAFAIPRFFDLQSFAEAKVLDAALDEGACRVSHHFAMSLLNGKAPGEIVYDNSTIDPELGDFVLSTTETTGITLVVTGKPGTQLAGRGRSRIIPRPGSS